MTFTGRRPQRFCQWAGLLLLLSGAMACLKTPAPASLSVPDGVFKFSINVPQAEVWRHGIFIGEAADFRGGMALSPGIHRIAFIHDDFYTNYQEVSIETGKTIRLQIQMLPKL